MRRALAAKIGIGISGLHWVLVQTGGFVPWGSNNMMPTDARYLTHPDAAVRAHTSAYFVEIVDCCADLGGTRIIVGSPKQRDIMDGVTFEQAWAWATEVFRAAVKRAEERGVVLCFEPLAPVETNFVNTAAEGRRFAAQFASRAMSIILDVKAMSSEPTPIPQIIRESAGKFEYFHANDPNLKGPGFGEMDFAPIAAALRDAHYDGIVSVEVFNFDEGPEVIATQSREYLRKTFGC